MNLVGSVTLSVYLRIARRIVFWTLITILSSVALWQAYWQLSKSQPSADAPAWAYDTDQPSAAGAADGRQVADVLKRSIDAWNRDDKPGFCAAFLASPSLTMTYHYPEARGNNDLNTVDMVGWNGLLQLCSEYTNDRANMGHVTIKRIKIRMLSPDMAYAVSSWRIDTSFLHANATDCSILLSTRDGWKIAADTSTFLGPIAQAGSSTNSQ
jgi:hypothetical protein